MSSRRIGAHVPASGGLAKRALGYAETIGAEAIQVFVSNPRGWATPEGDLTADLKFRELAAERDISTWVHAPFLINLGSPTEATYINSLAATSYALKRSGEIGAHGAVIHTGSAVNASHVEKAWKQIHDGMMPILDALGDDAPYLLLEPTAGQGQSLCRTLEDLTHYLEALEYHPKVGICLDTCHVFAAGYDLAAEGGVKSTLDLLVEVVGDRLKLIHANDSMDICGSLKDRHANLGEGHIGSAPFQDLLSHGATAGVPFILETPGNEPEHGREVALLKELRNL
jgi:deoxyribonuclease-4